MLRDTGKASWVTGIELVPEMGEIARASLDEVRIGNVEDMEFEWEPGCFDCFLLGDVLEHIYNPWRLLRRLRPFLAADGIVVASIPNVRHWPVIAGLVLHDDWPYTDCGVLDITHLRFFTRRTAMRMFSETGYAIEIVQPYFNSRRYSIPNSFTFGVLAGFFSVGWLMRLQAA
jgi:2-polyprenyl-3-methyl-5-hydroxy-6-metoxy-1,4-benzoquinol methylase